MNDGVFRDKKFEELDWISQAVEPIQSPLNDILSLLPDTFEVSAKDLAENIRWSGQIDTIYLVGLKLKAYINSNIELKRQIGDFEQDQIYILYDCYSLDAPEENILNAEESKLEKPIFIKKTETTISQDALKLILGKQGINRLYNYWPRESDLSKINDVFDILGKCEDGKRTRSSRGKRSVLFSRINKLFVENEWNIKCTVLADKVSLWIYEYLQNDNLKAYSNLCRLKVMTHSGRAIYSMEEL